MRRLTRSTILPALLTLMTPGAILVAPDARAAESITYYHWDALGSPVAATDEQGNVRWREQYAPYGERLQNETPSQINTRWYTGHPTDSATGLTYMGARWYDPVVGRFYAIDPKGLKEGNLNTFNRYTYGNNNPYSFLDPDGQDSYLALSWMRWSGPNDKGHSASHPYRIYGYLIYDLEGAGNMARARSLPPVGSIELSFEARMSGARGDILGTEPSAGEVFLTPSGMKHKIGIRNVGSKSDSFSENSPGGLTYYGIRIHCGGPDASRACATGPKASCSGRGAQDFEDGVISAVGALHRKQGERAQLEIPSDRWSPVAGRTYPNNW